MAAKEPLIVARKRMAGALGAAGRQLWRRQDIGDNDLLILDLVSEALVRLGAILRPSVGRPAEEVLSEGPGHVWAQARLLADLATRKSPDSVQPKQLKFKHHKFNPHALPFVPSTIGVAATDGHEVVLPLLQDPDHEDDEHEEGMDLYFGDVERESVAKELSDSVSDCDSPQAPAPVRLLEGYGFGSASSGAMPPCDKGSGVTGDDRAFLAGTLRTREAPWSERLRMKRAKKKTRAELQQWRVFADRRRALSLEAYTSRFKGGWIYCDGIQVPKTVEGLEELRRRTGAVMTLAEATREHPLERGCMLC